MPIVEVRCPRCGSPSNLQRGKTNEYVCSSCGAAFRFVDQTKRVVTTDILTRNCLHCGKPIDAGRGFKCTRCGEEFFCDSCVDEVEGKYVCASCLITSQQNCNFCKKYAVYRCVKCGKRACKSHPSRNFAYKDNYTSNGVRYYGNLVDYCPKCRGYVCRSCRQVVGLFIRSTVCPKCGSRLSSRTPYK